MIEEQLLTLLQKVRDDGDKAARTELNELLRKHPEARTTMAKSLVDEQALVSQLRDESIVSILDGEEETRTRLTPDRPARHSLAWPQHVAASLVAGVLVGVLGVGMVWASVSPGAVVRVFRIAHGNFDSLDVGPIPNRFPVRFGEWCGNPAEVIKDADGSRVLRFLKTESINGDPGDLASNCSVFQLVDLSSVRRQWQTADPESQVILNLSARFRRKAAPTDTTLPKLAGSCRIYLFNMKPKAISEGWPGVVREDGIGFGKKAITLAPGEEPATITASCLLESDATVALIAVAASTKSRAAPIELGGYFVDEV